MAKRKLTDALVKNLPAPEAGQADYFDTLLPAFGVRISYGGSKTWFVTARIAGQPKLIRVKVGRYPDLGLAEARTMARRMLEMAASGRDPRSIKQSEIDENQRRALQTFGAMADDFLVKHAQKAKKPLRANTVDAYRRTFEKVCKLWRARPVAEISRGDILALLDGLDAKGFHVAGDMAFANLRKFFNWLVDHDVIETAPTSSIRRAGSSVARARVLDPDEIKLVWTAFDDLGYPFGPLFKLLLLTGQRRNELASLERVELRDWSSDAPFLDLPGSRTKNRLPHLVPVVPAVKDLVEACPMLGPYVFTTTGKTPVSGFSKAKAAVDAQILAAMKRATNKPDEVKPLPGWTLHDLRRTMSTHMNERLGIAPHVVEAVINHISGARAGIAGVYNRALYLDARRAALAAWADWVRQL